jgi:tetratricopeptide (TPR) repeat protein/transglutaminase-like putative cysteine protease
MPGAVRNSQSHFAICIAFALFVFFAEPGNLVKAQQATADKGFVIEKLETNVRFAADGTSEREQIVQVHLQSDAAVRQFGVLSFAFDNDGERVAVDYVRVRKADGSTVETPASNFQETRSAVGTIAPMYSDLRETQIPVKALAKGDTLEYRTRWIRTKPVVQNQFWYEHDFVQDAPVQEETLTVSVPPGQFVKLSSPGMPSQVREENGLKTYFWKTAHLETKAPDNTQKTKSAKKPAHSVQLTTFRSWEEVGRWYAQLSAEKTAVTPAIQAKSAELVKGLSTNAEKQRAIYDYVSTRFRYISVSLGVGRYQPHAAEEVMSNLYGDCKDKHTLLAALLKAAGIEAWPALIGAGLPFDPDVPSPGQFNHLITVVPGEGGYVWLDSTPEVAPFGLLQKTLRNQQALVMPSSGLPKLMTTPAEPAVPHSERLQVKAVLKSDGTLTGHIDITTRGDAELILRSVFHQTSPSQWQEVAQRISLGSGYAGKVSAVDIDNPQDTTKPFHYGYDYTRENYPDWANLRISPPFPGLGLPEQKEKPSEPIEVGNTGDYTYEASLTLPPGYSLEIPARMDQSSDFAEYHATWSFKDSVLTGQRTLTIRTEQVPVSGWEQYQRFRTAINGNQEQWIRLTPTGSAAGGGVAVSDARAETLIEQARTALRKQDSKGAQDALAEAERLNPKQPGLWNAYTALYALTRDVEKALQSGRKEIENYPMNTQNYRYLARMQVAYKRPDDAVSTWRDLLKISPADRDAALQLTALLISNKRFEEALDAARSGLTAAPGDVELEAIHAMALLRAGRKSDGIAAAREVAGHSPSPKILNDVAWSLVDTGADISLAADYAGRALLTTETELKDLTLPDLKAEQLREVVLLGHVWDTAGWASFLSGDDSQAEKYVEAAWKLNQNGTVGDHLGQIYDRQGKKDAAIAVWRLALAADNSLDSVRERLPPAPPPSVVRNGSNRSTPAAAAVAPAEALGKMRTAAVPAFSRPKGTAEFFVLFSTKGVEDTAFISGENDLRAAKDAIAKAKFDMPFPDNGPEKIARRAILSCSQYTTPNCQLVLLPTSSTTPP